MFSAVIAVRVEGLEPPSLAALDPKSSVSTNFTTPALGTAKVAKFPNRTTAIDVSCNSFCRSCHLRPAIFIILVACSLTDHHIS